MGKVVIIGGGPGGVAAAIRSAQLGAEVSIIEANDVERVSTKGVENQKWL